MKRGRGRRRDSTVLPNGDRRIGGGRALVAVVGYCRALVQYANALPLPPSTTVLLYSTQGYAVQQYCSGRITAPDYLGASVVFRR
ncbi:unnamed protein product [Chondrus crispus]|uniref:Uncharacterized protein n=1 Tax=Chondrus crispus TaxID=2769 RepID=R7QCT8_CHOCR|nr:unnamed protein product [Chondrus crispus]CDF35884.1 unnamed protein product [Chondrus crispus]|eukprot:XP_005715703.1 unnamed protein product [Chondrus crispus]